MMRLMVGAVVYVTLQVSPGFRSSEIGVAVVTWIALRRTSLIEPP